MKKAVKILAIFMIMLMLCMVSTQVLANGGFIDPSDLGGTEISNKSELQGIGNTIIGIIQAVGSIIAVVVLLVLGIKYMMGSAEEKAEYKKTMLPYLIGAIILLFASNIVRVIFTAFGGIS